MYPETKFDNAGGQPRPESPMEEMRHRLEETAGRIAEMTSRVAAAADMLMGESPNVPSEPRGEVRAAPIYAGSIGGAFEALRSVENALVPLENQARRLSSLA